MKMCYGARTCECDDLWRYNNADIGIARSTLRTSVNKSGILRSSLFILQTAPFSGANIGICWIRVHALGAERHIEVNISNKTEI